VFRDDRDFAGSRLAFHPAHHHVVMLVELQSHDSTDPHVTEGFVPQCHSPTSVVEHWLFFFAICNLRCRPDYKPRRLQTSDSLHAAVEQLPQRQNPFKIETIIYCRNEFPMTCGWLH